MTQETAICSEGRFSLAISTISPLRPCHSSSQEENQNQMADREFWIVLAERPDVDLHQKTAIFNQHSSRQNVT